MTPFPRTDEENAVITNKLGGFRDGWDEGRRAGELDERGWIEAYLRRPEFEGRHDELAGLIGSGGYRVRMRAKP